MSQAPIPNGSAIMQVAMRERPRATSPKATPTQMERTSRTTTANQTTGASKPGL